MALLVRVPVMVAERQPEGESVRLSVGVREETSEAVLWAVALIESVPHCVAVKEGLPEGESVPESEAVWVALRHSVALGLPLKEAELLRHSVALGLTLKEAEPLPDSDGVALAQADSERLPVLQ